MKNLSKSKKMSALLGASLLVLGACAPDSLTRGGAAPAAPIERRTDDGAATTETEAEDKAAPGAQPAAQPAANSASRSTLSSPLPAPTAPSMPASQGEMEFTGTVEVIAGDTWVVGGRTVVVTAATEIEPGLAVGTLAKVHAQLQADGSLWAREIETAGIHDNANSNSNDNDNSNDDNGNGNVNSNDDQGNDDNGNGNVNSNDDRGNDDNGNGNSSDDHGGNNNDDHGGNGNDDGGGSSNDD